MTLAQIQHALGLGCLTPGLDLGREVTSAHASDLLSDALANAPAGGVLLTIQVHLNVVAVALHSQQAGVIFTWGMQPDEQVVNRAVEEGLPLFVAAASTFEIAGQLYALGVRGAPGAAVSREADQGSAPAEARPGQSPPGAPEPSGSPEKA